MLCLWKNGWNEVALRMSGMVGCVLCRSEEWNGWWNERKNERKKEEKGLRATLISLCGGVDQRRRQRTHNKTNKRRQHDPEQLSFPCLPFVLSFLPSRPSNRQDERAMAMDGRMGEQGVECSMPAERREIVLTLFTLVVLSSFLSFLRLSCFFS